MSEFYAVEDMDIAFVSGGDSGDLSIDSPPSTIDFFDGKGCYRTGDIISVSNFENANVINGNGAGPLIGTGKNLTNGKLVCKEKDIAILTGSGTNKNPPPATTSFTTTVEITDPNQSKAKGV
jgi:hypothetical protein